jgi:dienelactone hydrolase
MIVYTYELLSQNLHGWQPPTERNYYNFTAWTQQGYFVLLPDIVYRGGDPGRSAVDAVVPAVHSIVARGLIDSARVGLIGHSWGGYQATYIPTQTNIFAASVAGAPITNFLSFAGAIHWTPGIAEFDHWETGQARMGAPPWEAFEAHVRNSPAASIANLKTPMLMEVGDADGTVDWHQGIEFYNFARRAGKQDFVMLVYPGEDHGLRKKENQIDYHRGSCSGSATGSRASRSRTGSRTACRGRSGSEFSRQTSRGRALPGPTNHGGVFQPPTSATSRSACDGPQVPGSYGWTSPAPCRSGSTIAHACSTVSCRANSVASPAIASPRRRS